MSKRNFSNEELIDLIIEYAKKEGTDEEDSGYLYDLRLEILNRLEGEDGD